MGKNIIVVIIVIIIFLIIVLEATLYAKRVIKNGKKAKAKVLKIEYERMMSAECDDPLRHWYNLEIEINNKILKRQVAITEFTKTLKEGDYVDVLVHKNDFLLESELGEYKKQKNDLYK